jgi:hypothetical protein
MGERGDMVPEQPLTTFISWLMQDPHRLEGYDSREGFDELVERWGFQLPAQALKVLDDNDLRGAQDVLRKENGGKDPDGILRYHGQDNIIRDANDLGRALKASRQVNGGQDPPGIQ